MSTKIALAAAVLVAGLASPAFAGGYPGDFANRLPYTASSAPYPVTQTHAVMRNGNEAFAFAPSQGLFLDRSAAFAGGASAGYNQAEENAVTNR